MGGHDSASSRYIHTELNKIVDILYPPVDFELLDYTEDDGNKVEPKYYVPIIPMVLVNGMTGIGTGFSTSVPKFNPKDVVKNIENKLKGKDYEEMKPWYNNFKGEIIKINDTDFISKGKYEILTPTSIRITELPIGKWTDDYKVFLDSLLPEEKKKKSKENEKVKKSKVKQNIIDYTNNSSDKEIDFTLIVPLGFIHNLQWSEDPHIDGIEKYLKLYTTKGLSLKNIHLYDKERIVKYSSVKDIIDVFFQERYQLYVSRKEKQLKDLKNELDIKENKIRFIHDVIEEKIIIYKRKREEIFNNLIKFEYKQIKDKYIQDKINITNKTGYDYLVKMSIYSFTEEEYTKLEEENNNIKLIYEDLLKKTIEDIWLDECKEFKRFYNKVNP